MTVEPEVLGSAIIREASRFIGLREVRPNADWDDPRTPAREIALANDLRALMRPSPWQEGWAYCAAFCEGIVTNALRQCGASQAQRAVWQRHMTPHCVTSAGNFKRLRLLSNEAQPGAVWLARHGSTSNGHAGIVTAIRGVSLCTIEANTSLDATSAERDREGDWITTRIFNWRGRGSLTTLGFINPDAVIRLVFGLEGHA